MTIFLTGNARNRSAFSLIEVLVAVLIVSVGVTAVLSSYNMSLSAMGASRDGLTATRLLAQKFDDIRQGGLPPVSSGECGEPFKEFTWEVSTVPATWADAPDLYEVTVTMHNKNTGVSYPVTTCMLLR